MRILIVLFVMVVGCTKQNPQACCTDAVDCMNVGLPQGTTCGDGLLCRGNRCVEELCKSAGECDVTAPYCVMSDEGRCSESCNADSQCPGFSQSASDTFCVAGGCVECRSGMSDCPIDKPLCSDDGACVACVEHVDCPSGVCANGTCASENQIAFVATNGAPASECTKASPCNSIERGLALAPARPYILIDAGIYSSTATITLAGTRWLIGRGASRPVLTRSTDGPILTTAAGADAKLEHLEVFGAKGITEPNVGHGIRCSFGAPKVALVDVGIRMNVTGVSGTGCALTARGSLFEGNSGSAVAIIDGTADIDGCTVIGNGLGLTLDNGNFSVTNSILARNSGYGLDLYSTANGNIVAFNTVIDNGHTSGLGGGISCNIQGAASGAFENNIIARNLPTQTSGNECTFPNSLMFDGDITALKLKRPDSAPYDYHLQPGSAAVDLAGASTTIKIDIDGESRPFGAANDIGADELH